MISLRKGLKNLQLLIKKQITQNKISILGTLGISLLIIFTLVGFCYFTNNSIATLTRDPLALADLPFYAGSFSQLGNMFWFIAAGISFFTYYLTTGKYKAFLLFSAIFSLFLGLDDLLMIHDGLLPKIGINGNLIYIIFGLYAFSYLTLFHKLILKTPFIILLLAFTFLGLSAISDLYKISGINPYIFEDGFKMIGIVSWLVYHLKVSQLEIKRIIKKQQVISIQRNIDSLNSGNLQKVVGE